MRRGLRRRVRREGVRGRGKKRGVRRDEGEEEG